MDYEIELSTLESKKSELEELKQKGEDIYNEFNGSYLSTGISGTEISSLTNKIKTPIERIKKGLSNSSTWYTSYTSELTALEDSLAAFSASSLTAPTEFSGEFTDMFGKVTIPTLKTGGDIHANYEKFGNPDGDVTGENKTNGNVIDTSTPVEIGNKYNLSDEDLKYLAYVALREQGSVEGAKLELSLMANLYEKNKNKFSSVTDYVKNSGWFASRSRSNYSYPGDEYYQAAKEVLNDGKRYLTSNVVEHDCISDITSISTGSKKDRSNYIPGKTIIKTKYDATYVFVGFAPNGGDPFGILV